MWEIVVSLPGLTSEAGAIGPEVLVPAKAHLHPAFFEGLGYHPSRSSTHPVLPACNPKLSGGIGGMTRSSAWHRESVKMLSMEPAQALDRDRIAIATALVVFVVGMASLGTEIAGARLLAPYFGTSTIIWANTIAVVLLSLSVGYWFGGRLADSNPTLQGLCRLVLAAAVLLAIVPLAARPFLSAAASALDSVSAGGFLGSLGAVLVLLSGPLVLLGAASPYAVRLSVRTVEQSGRITGRLYAISTLGSLVGVFIAALALIPFAGTRMTFLAFSLALAAVATIGLGTRALIAAAFVIGVMLLPAGEVKAATAGDRVLTEQETEYGFARVVESPSGERRLELNEGLAIHSILQADRSPTVGGYWDELSVLPWAVERKNGAEPKRIAILGNAAGTIARSLTTLHPNLRVDGVEIDGRLTEIGERWFDLKPSANLHVYTADARPFMRRSHDHYDAVLLDAYRQPYVPFHLATKEFFEVVKERLAPNGGLVVNVGHPASDNGLEKALSATLGAVFTHVVRDPAQDENTQLIASDTPVTSRALARAAGTFPPSLSGTALGASSRISPALKGGSVWTDDRAPVEWLIDGSIVEEAGRR